MTAFALGRIDAILAIVEACLCDSFPNDFFRRCAFAAFGVRALLQDLGIDAVIVGGQFAALVITPDQARIAVQGFRSGRELFPHFWVEAADRLIDLGPYLLPFGSDYPVLPMPAVSWDMSAPLPESIRYRARRRLPPSNQMSTDSAINAQCDAFVAQCRAMAASGAPPPRFPTWIATNYASLLAAVDRGDHWALGAKRFEQLARHHPLPF